LRQLFPTTVHAVSHSSHPPGKLSRNSTKLSFRASRTPYRVRGRLVVRDPESRKPAKDRIILDPGSHPAPRDLAGMTNCHRVSMVEGEKEKFVSLCPHFLLMITRSMALLLPLPLGSAGCPRATTAMSSQLSGTSRISSTASLLLRISPNHTAPKPR